MQQLRLAFRTLWKTPFVTGVAILSLALGIGANSAIFSLFDEMILRDLPVPAPDRLVNLSSPGPKQGSTSCGQAGSCDSVFSYPMFRDLERDNEVFSSMAAHVGFGASVGFEGRSESTEGKVVSGGYFRTLALGPALGRLIEPEDDAVIAGSPVVVLGHRYWQDRFGGRTDVLDKTLIVNGKSLTIIGVAPAGFVSNVLGSRPDIFVPMTMYAELSSHWDDFENRKSYFAYLFARLAPNVSREQAETVLGPRYSAILEEVEAPLQSGVSESFMTRFVGKQLELHSGARGQSSMHGEVSTPLLLLFSVAGVVLLIACANIANLLLARSASRAGEIALRLSIGAPRRKLVSQLLLESCLLAVLGGVAGLLFARWTLSAIGALLPEDAVRGLTIGLDPRAMLFAMVVALGTGVLFGVFPALHSTKPDLATTLKGQSGQASSARSAARFRTVLVTVQIALSTTLLVASGLFLKSLVNVSRVDLGLEVERLATFRISPERNGYSFEQSRTLFIRLEDELAAVPGVESVTTSMVPLLTGSNWGRNVNVEGFDADPDTDTNANYNTIGPGYFETLGVPIFAGREFNEADTGEVTTVAIVNQTFAEKFGLGRDAVGKRMSLGSGDELDIEIVGLVPDVKYSEVKDATPPLFFVPYRQDDAVGSLSFYVRGTGAIEGVLRALPEAVAKLDPNLPVDQLTTMRQQVRENVFLDRLLTTLSAAFAILATLLAAVGLYGVLAYTVSQRTREFGLRMVLGAQRGSVERLVLRQVARMAVVGAAIGLVAALALGRLASSQLFELEGHDPTVLGGAVVLLALVALGSGLIPARRASRVEPMRALRYE